MVVRLEMAALVANAADDVEVEAKRSQQQEDKTPRGRLFLSLASCGLFLVCAMLYFWNAEIAGEEVKGTVLIDSPVASSRPVVDPQNRRLSSRPQTVVIKEKKADPKKYEKKVVVQTALSLEKHWNRTDTICRNGEYTRGYWNRTEIFMNMGPAVNYGDKGPTEASKWDWIQSCHLEAFDRQRFCESLGNRSIIFVGDSITHLHAMALYNLMEPNANHFLQFQGPPLSKSRTAVTRTICGHLSLTYARNDYMRLDETSYGFELHAHRGLPWIHFLATHKVAVINTGAHWGNNFTGYLSKIQELSRFVGARENDEVEWIFRTSPRGHIGCQLTDSPLPKETVVENTAYFDGSLKKYFGYGYHYFPEYNRLASKYLGQYMKILDVTPMTESRPDNHLKPPHDCLHYRHEPGPVDQWNWFLMNILLGNLE